MLRTFTRVLDDHHRRHFSSHSPHVAITRLLIPPEFITLPLRERLAQLYAFWEAHVDFLCSHDADNDRIGDLCDELHRQVEELGRYGAPTPFTPMTINVPDPRFGDWFMVMVKRCEKEVLGSWAEKQQQAKEWLNYLVPHYCNRCRPGDGCPAKHTPVTQQPGAGGGDCTAGAPRSRHSCACIGAG